MIGQWSREWGTLMNFDIKTVDSGIKHNTTVKWAREILVTTW
jgi:hypothetical protein